VRAPPICRKPVGEGAKRVTMVSLMALDFVGPLTPAREAREASQPGKPQM